MQKKDDSWERDDLKYKYGPPGLRMLTADDLENLGLDKNGHIYFQGKKLAVSNEISLTAYQVVVTAVAAASTAVMAIVELLTFFGIAWR
jgi:hypothetical protein